MNEIKIENAQIEKITLYTRGAEVVRTASFELTKGENKVTFTGLPAAFAPERTQLDGRGGFTIVSVSPTTVACEAESPEIAAQRKSVAALTEQKRLLAAQENFLNQNMRVGGAQGVSQKEISEYFAYFAAQCEKVGKARCDNGEKLDEAQRKLDALLALEKERGETATRQEVEAVLLAPAPGKGTLTLKSFTFAAGYRPQYVLCADAAGKTLHCAFVADAYQTTGEDWTNASVVFRSSQPGAGLYVPRFEPAYVGGAPEPVALRAKAVPMAMAAGPNEATPVSSFAAEYVNEDESAGDTAFEIAALLSVRSGEKNRRVTLREEEIDCVYAYRVVPPVDTTVFLTAKVKAGAFGFSGKADVYEGGAYSGQTEVSPDTDEVCIARANQFVCVRKQEGRYNENRLLGGEKTELSYRVTLVSAGKNAAEITVIDRIPVSQNKAVTVEATERSGAAEDRTNGKLTWRVTLPAGGKKELTVRYRMVDKQK